MCFSGFGSFFSGLESFPRDVCKVFSTKCTPLLNQSRFSMFILSWGCTSCWVCTKFLVFWHHCWSHINFSPVCHVGIPGLHQVGWYEGGWHHRWPHHIRKLFLNSLPSKAAALSAKLHNSSTKTPIVSASGSLSLSWPSSSQFFWKTRKSLFPQARRAWIGSFSPFYHLSLRQKSVSDVTDRFPQTSIQMVGDHCLGWVGGDYGSLLHNSMFWGLFIRNSIIITDPLYTSYTHRSSLYNRVPLPFPCPPSGNGNCQGWQKPPGCSCRSPGRSPHTFPRSQSRSELNWFKID